MVSPIPRPDNDDVARTQDDIVAISHGRIHLYENVVVAAPPLVIRDPQCVRRELLACARDDAKLRPLRRFTCLFCAVFRSFVSQEEGGVWWGIREEQEGGQARWCRRPMNGRAVGCDAGRVTSEASCAGHRAPEGMRDYTCDHAIELEDGGDVDEVRREIGRGRDGGRAGPGAHTRHLDLVCPCNEKCRVVLPVEGALEEVCAGAVGWTVDVGDARLGDGVVYLDTLLRGLAGAEMRARSYAPNHLPMQ